MNFEDEDNAVINRMVEIHLNPLSDGTLTPNYCESPADAWPIIKDNNILVSGKGWALVDDLLSEPYETHDKNPLRAAMIVFLKMKALDDPMGDKK